MIKYNFCNKKDAAFSSELKNRVNTYFKENNLKKNANTEMVLKTFAALGLYLLPYFIIVFTAPANVFILLLLWSLMGLGIAFIGTSVMHDSLHGSYSKNKKINFLIGGSAWLLGVDAKIWKLQHNVLHHTYTNIEHADEDIEPRYVLRLSPHQPKKWFHRYQHIYVVFFYSISTLIWVTLKDYVKLFNYRKKNLLKKDESFLWRLIGLFLRKISYFLIFLVIPIYILPISMGTTILLFITMHLVAGLSLSMVFQPAHVIETSDFVLKDDGEVNENWAVHQLMTTSNFALKSWWVSWFTGGLNHQIEHHLFPHICHIHYPQISKIVQATTHEYNLPYYTQETFGKAIYHHFKTLKELGSGTFTKH